MIKKNIYITLTVCLLTAIRGTVNAQDRIVSSRPVLAKDSITIPYGSVSRKNLINSIATVDSSAIMKSNVFSAGNALNGRLLGLFVQQTSGEPDNDEPLLRLRGVSTTTSNLPMVIVDGIERNLNDVLIDDISEVSVLKDASATAIYGIRGANGVVLITTKRGSAHKLQVKGIIEQGFQNPTKSPGFRSSAEYATLYNQALVNDGLPEAFSAAQIDGYQNGDHYYFPNVKWEDEVLNEYSPSTRANVNFNGGEKTAKYFISLGYLGNQGLLKNTDVAEDYNTNLSLQNLSFRSNLDVNVTDHWKFNLDLSGRVYEKNSPISTTDDLFDDIYKYPGHLFPVYVANDVYGGSPLYSDNPVGQVRSRGYQDIVNRLFLATVGTQYDFSSVIKGLSAGLKYSSDNFYKANSGFTKNFSVTELSGQDPITGEPLLGTPIGQTTELSSFGPNGDVQNRRNTFESNISFDKSFGTNSTLKSVLIYHQDKLTIDKSSPNVYQYLSGRFNYGFKNKYLAEFGFSYSGTEAFPQDKNFGFFPAVAAGWKLSEENFLKNSKSINFLKLRASAGIVGNSSIGARFLNISQYGSGNDYYFGNTNKKDDGLSSGSVANDNFTWETAYKYDLGLEARLFKNLDFSFTYFIQNRKDILASEEALVPGIFGGNFRSTNGTETSNNGFETSLFYAKKSDRFGFHAGINVAYAKNEVVYTPEIQPFAYLNRSGQAINQPFILEALGFFESQADIDSSPTQTYGTVKPGDIKYKDQNGDGIIDDTDLVPLKSNGIPDMDLGFDLGFTFKNFDVSAFFHGQFGRDIYLGDTPLLFWPLTNNGARISSYPQQFWTPQTAATADYPRLTTLQNDNNYRKSTQWYVNGDFLRLRTLNVGYTLPKSVSSKLKMTNLRLFVRGMNLFTISKFDYADPESQSGYPILKSYNVGLTAQF